MDGLILPSSGQSMAEPTKNGISGEAQNISPVDESLDDNASRATPEPIVIVGMAMRLPGSVRTAEKFWNMLINKDDCSSEVPKSRYNIDAFYHPDKPQSVRTRRGFFLDDEYLGKADMEFLNNMSSFGIRDLDPQQMLLMEVIYECMENAGQTGWRGKDIGCYVGVFGEDWHELTAKETQRIPRVQAFANGGFALSNRVSYEFDLKGPSTTIMTACSSSLVALNEACQAIHEGNCSSAIVAGTNVLLSPSMTVNMSENMVLSPEGYCKVFDVRADGYARGEAVNAIYIKTLQQAVLDGDHIHAVIRGTSTNYDGKTEKIFAPGIDSQERLIMKAYRQAQIHDITQTAFVECHGTGTKVGDVVETTAVARAFRGAGVYIGSVKSNIGHGEGASGLSSLIKAVLALQHRIIPPNMHFNHPNPRIPFEKGGLRVPTEPVPWPRNRKERVSVNCFGIGGSNAHTILESIAAPGASDRNDDTHRRTVPQLLVLSAYSKSALETRVQDMLEYVSKRPGRVGDLAYTLGARRDHLTYRAFILIDSKTTEPGEPQYSISPGQSRPDVIFTFSGQGSSWPGMGAELMKTFAIFERDIQEMDQILQGIESPPRWSIEDALQSPSGCRDCSSAEYSQTLIAAVQIALVTLLRSWGIQPSAVVGHSSGEVIAAYAANAIPMRTAIIVAHFRGQCIKAHGIPGGMAVIGLSEATTQQFLVDGVVISCKMSPESVNISGNKEKLAIVIDRILTEMPDTFVKYVPVEVAYHSPDMQKIGPSFGSSIAPYILPNDSMTPMYSTVTGSVISSPAQLDAAYWRRNLESPVLFSGAVQALLEDKKDRTNAFVEIGPHSALSGPLRQIFSNHDVPTHYIPTLLRSKDQAHCLLQTAGELFLHHYPVSLRAMNGKGRLLTDLPVYPWDRRDINWQESRLSRNWRFRRHSHHELLGSRMLEASDLEPAWRNLLNARDVTWLSDHKVMGEIVFPCAGYIAMINEAIRQLFNTHDCTIRNLYMKAPLVLPQSDNTIELVTTARPVRISDRLDSSWYEFTIIAYNGTDWTKHTIAQAKPGTEELILSPKVIKPFPRLVSSTLWYSELERIGLEYGPCFQGLEDITADPSEFTANATLRSSIDSAESPSIHPATIDQCLQLFSVAACNGKALNMSSLYIPMSIDKIYIGPSRPVMKAEAGGVQPSGNLCCGSVVLRAEKEHVLSMDGVNHARLINSKETERDSIPLASYAEWLPDIDLLPNHQHLSQSQSQEDETFLTMRLSVISIIQISHHIADVIPTSEFRNDYKKWIQSQVRSIQTGDVLGIPEAPKWTMMDDKALQLEHSSLNEKLRARDLDFISRQSQLAVDSSRDFVQGSIDPGVVLANDSSLRILDDWGSSMGSLSSWFSLLRHSNPVLRVLEIGAAKGSFSSCVRRYLTSDELKFYSLYTCTEASPVNPAVEERFKEDKRVEFKMLDIGLDPMQQGFQRGSYDLVIASDLSTREFELGTALQNIKKLLVPRGRLFLREQGPGLSVVKNLHIPILPPSERLSEGSKCTTVEMWDRELRNAGFNGIEEHDSSPLYQLHFNMITRLSYDSQPSPPINLLCLNQKHANPWICGIEDKLRQKGYDVQRCILGQGIPPKGLVISLLDLDGPFFHNISEEDWKLFQSFINLSPRILWVTQSIELSCQNPDFALVLGVSRTARQEQGLHFGTLQIDSFDNIAVQALAKVSRKFIEETGRETKETDIDYEFALHKGTIYIPRFHWTSLTDQLRHDPEPGVPIRLDIENYGMVDSLRWVEDNPGPLGLDEVEVDIKYVGLNFRDIMIALGVMANKSEFGVEGSGIVRRCGNDVKGFKPGDRVIISKPGLFCSRTTISVDRCAVLPESLSLEDAATMAVVYATALYCLVDIARLEEGQSVLIHAACGGVGLAAIQVCQMIGAEIYATVGNEEKAQYLVQNFGLPRHRIFNSRDVSFLPDLMRGTEGQGVDVVLNSLAGELLHASWKCVAEFGKMIEIGKRDFMEHSVLGLEAFAGNRAFFGVDLIRLSEKPGLTARLARQTLKLYEEGKIHPIRPLQVVAASGVQKVFRSMQQGSHRGKIVVKIPGDSDEAPIFKSVYRLSFSPEVSYILVGGLGGVGRALATWMVDRGARSLVFLSRSAGRSSDDQSFLRELEAQGCTPIIARGDVTKLEDVKAAIERCPWPIGGVLQLSMLVRDQFIPDMTYKNWQDGLSPKVAGTWNLHHALDGKDGHLRFFVVCGSITGVMGNAGQVNYSAANSFVASFAQYRLQKGLPASVVNLGGVDDVGFLATQDTKLRENMRSSSVRLLRESEVLDAFELAMSQSQTNHSPVISSPGSLRAASNDLVVGMSSTKSLTDPSVRPLWGQDARFRVYANLDANRETSESLLQGVASLQAQLAAVEQHPDILNDPTQWNRLITEIVKNIQEYSIFARDLEYAQVIAMPIDSLMTVEIRNWCTRYLKLDLSLAAIGKAGTVEGLSHLVVATLRSKHLKQS